MHIPVTAAASPTVKLAGQLTVKPDEGLVNAPMLTVPVNPFDGVTVIVEDEPLAPVLKSTGEVAVRVKSLPPVNVNVAVVE